MQSAHLSDDDLELYIRGGSLDTENSEAHLDECPICREKLRDSALFMLDLATVRRYKWSSGDRDRRAEPRMLMRETASLRVLSPVPAGRSEVSVINLSKSGLMVRVPVPVEPGSIVQLRRKQVLVMGEVRYCLKVNDGFHLGIVIQDMQ